MHLSFKIFIVLILLFSTAVVPGQILTGPGQISPGNINDEEPESAEPTTNPEINKVISIVNEVEEKNNFIDQLGTDSVASLPFGIIKQIGSVRYIIAIDSMKFKSGGAFFSAYAALDFPGTLKKLTFKASNIKFNPSGVVGGDQAKLYLASDHLIRINACVSLKLLSNGQNWVEWDCNGFKAINLVGNFIFRKTKLIPEPPLNSDSAVTASFQIYTKDIHQFIANVNITPFQIKGLKDWSFKVTNATVDMSEIANAQSMIFPKDYPTNNLVNPNMWTGFSLQSLKIKLPTEISKTGKKTEIEVNNMLIDNLGLSGSFQVNNLFTTEEGSMSGWDFSIDQLSVGFLCNQVSSAKIKGAIEIPITDNEQKFQYTANANYSYQRKELDFNFIINPMKEVRFNVFSANVLLNSNSSIMVSKVNGYFKPIANLHGKISFDDPKLNSKGGQLLFQNLVVSTDAPFIEGGIFTIHSVNEAQSESSKYPLVINDISFGINQGIPILGFNVMLNFSEYIHNVLTVGTTILIKGKIEPREQFYQSDVAKQGITFTKTKWSLDKVVMSGISVDIETSPFSLKGLIDYKESVPVYGSGFFGLLDFSLKKIIEEPVAISVGFGTKEDFRYFFLDTKIPSKYIIPSTPIGISRIIGGMYYHMKPHITDEDAFLNLNASFNNIAGNALIYTPDKKTILGFKAGVTGEFILNESALNGDFLLDVNFNTSGGLGAVSLGGNMYSMATIAKRQQAPVRGKINFIYDYNNKTFDATADVTMSYHSIISGNGTLKFHSDPINWHLCIGRPSAPNNIRFLNLAEAPSYFMMGNSIEPAMSPPASVVEKFGDRFSNRNQTNLQNGSGTCIGARIHSKINKEIGVDFFRAACDFGFDLGFDMMFLDYGENATCQNDDSKIGLNGKLAEGEVYLHMNGSTSIRGHLKFPANCPITAEVCANCCGCCCPYTIPCIIDKDFNKTIFSGTANAIAQAKFPKPLYFNGKVNFEYSIFDKVSGNFDFNMEYGNDCIPVRN